MIHNEVSFNDYIPKLQGWINKNIYFYANDLVGNLFECKNITFEDIDNIYKELKKEDYETIAEYENALDNQVPQIVYQWFSVSNQAYHKFKNLGDPVIKLKELYIWGRTMTNQLIYMDYKYQPLTIEYLLST